MKTAKDYLEAANREVPRMSADDAIKRHGTDAVFIDVRDSAGIAESGTIKGALKIPRGMIEFVADSNTSFHNSALQPDADIYLVCGAGGQAALAGATLKEMGFKSVTNIGGFGDWKDAGGPVE